MDLKAAFDTVSRKTVVEAVKGRGVREGLVERIDSKRNKVQSKNRWGGRRGILDGERGETGLPDESNIVQPGTGGPRRGVKESEVGRNKDR